MPIENIYLIGAGGHAKVVLDALFLIGTPPEQVRLLDDALHLQGQQILGCTIETPIRCNQITGARFHLAIGSPRVRERLFAELEASGAHALTVKHMLASISPFASVGQGSFVAAHAVLAPDSRLGNSVIINHGAVVDHDCIVGNFSHIAPHATLGGGVRVGTGVLIGAGANVLPRVVIGDGAVIGAGAAVTANVAAGEIKAGIPAKKLKGS